MKISLGHVLTVVTIFFFFLQLCFIDFLFFSETVTNNTKRSAPIRRVMYRPQLSSTTAYFAA